MKCGGVMTLVPVGLLLTLSYFVLLSAQKAATRGLKLFGKFVAVVLWIATAVIFLTSMYYTMAMPQCSWKSKRCSMQKGMMRAPMVKPDASSYMQ